jgi:choline dehydrogenase-like flavoprotein
VCDASIFSRATKANPQQAIMTMAWRAADIIVQTKKGYTDKDLGSDEQHADKGEKVVRHQKHDLPKTFELCNKTNSRPEKQSSQQ